jgi:HD-GYP domain-containing protein (c-di-GMP phosphodiesterase class II)
MVVFLNTIFVPDYRAMTIKKISIDRLQPGMFVHDLNWSSNSGHLIHGHFSVADEPQIAALRELGVRELYIDTVLGDDAREAPTMQDVRSGLEAQLLEIGQGAENNFSRDVHEEIEQARSVHESATLFVGNLMSQVRTGALEDVGHELLDLAQGLNLSVSRNPHALISLAQVRDRDDYTFLHSVGSAILMGAFCRTLHLGGEAGRHLVIGALLHDVGKMRVDNAILNKPGCLTAEEFEHIKQHVRFGEEILAEQPLLAETSLMVARQHHERLDGTGYPRGLDEREISHFGQMAAIVDVYDALTSERVYHSAMEPVEVILKLLEWSGQHLNGELVQHFIRTVGAFPDGTLVRLASGRLAQVIRQGVGGGVRPVVRMVYDTASRREITSPDIDLYNGAEDDLIVGWEAWEKWGLTPTPLLS